MDILYTFQSHPWLFYTTILFIGLCVGSFLNVVIYRLPVILNREWKLQCHEYLELDPPETKDILTPFNLSTPRSSCPSCGHMITAWENIPVISYLFLAAKCSSCQGHISIRYPLIELSTAIISLFIAYHFGVTIQCFAALLFTWTLIALTFIDIDEQLLPDNLTLPLMWLGIITALFGVFTDLQSSVIGAIAGYLILWLVFQGFKLATGKEGMGYGDFKLLAALGAWLGWELLPQVILLSSVIGTIIGIVLLLTGKTGTENKISFGPYLAIAGWTALIWGEQINTIYYSFL